MAEKRELASRKLATPTLQIVAGRRMAPSIQSETVNGKM
jgi:hypothetical protein